MIEQLTLDVGLHEDNTFENFFAGKNQQMALTLQTAAHGRGERFIYFWGEAGLGKTHLLQATCHDASALGLAPVYLPLRELVEHSPKVLEDLENIPLVCVDDVDAIAGRPAWEEAFFHFYNRMQEAKKRLLVSASVAPNELGLALPDLVSRLGWGVTYRVQPLTDDEKIEALSSRCVGKGLQMPRNVAVFLLSRWPRDSASLFGAIDKLDHASLVAKRKLSVPFVKDALRLR